MENAPADAGRPENIGGALTGLAKAGDWVAAFAKREGMGFPCFLKDSSGAAVGSGEGKGRGSATLLRKACDFDDGAGGWNCSDCSVLSRASCLVEDWPDDEA